VIIPMSQLGISSSPAQSTCVRLNLYGHRYHCEKKISFCIHDKSILLLGHMGACVYVSPPPTSQDTIALLIYELINYVHSFCSNKSLQIQYDLMSD
jgi:hypothetical protein